MAYDKDAFGNFLRERRLEADVTLRQLGAALKLSAAYLCDIEYGRRLPLDPKYWPKVAQTLNTTVKDLERHAIQTRPWPIDLTRAKALQREVVIALSRRVHERDLSDDECTKLLAILRP